MVTPDSQDEITDWSAVLRQLKTDRECILWTQREALLPLDWRPAGEPNAELLGAN